MSDLSSMLEDAMKDPRFSTILSSLKEKADAGELDVASLVGQIGEGGAGAKSTGQEVTKAVGAKPGMDSHKKLLAALKPYLGDAKRGAVENILKIGEFSGIIEALTKSRDGGR